MTAIRVNKAAWAGSIPLRSLVDIIDRPVRLKEKIQHINKLIGGTTTYEGPYKNQLICRRNGRLLFTASLE